MAAVMFVLPTPTPVILPDKPAELSMVATLGKELDQVTWFVMSETVPSEKLR